MDHGIETRYLQIIKDILMHSCRAIERVSLFGSRATGCFTCSSDIDLVLYGDILEEEAQVLFTCLHESLLPYRVDITVYNHVRYPPLKRHIDAVAKRLFSKEEMYSEAER